MSWDWQDLGIELERERKQKQRRDFWAGALLLAGVMLVSLLFWLKV